MAKKYISGGKIHLDTGTRKVITGENVVLETTAAAVGGRVMGKLAGNAGLAGLGGLAGRGGGLAG